MYEKKKKEKNSEISQNLIIINVGGSSHGTWFSYFFIKYLMRNASKVKKEKKNLAHLR